MCAYHTVPYLVQDCHSVTGGFFQNVGQKDCGGSQSAEVMSGGGDVKI